MQSLAGKARQEPLGHDLSALKRWEEMDGITISAVKSNVQDKAGIAALALAVGSR